jgi:aspartate/methionine/tyrosine aminotransferase
VRADRIAVTSSGVSALMLATQALAGPATRWSAVVPVWPNLTAQPAILGRECHARAAEGARRRLDAGHGRAAARHHDRTSCCSSNAPGNPTGWTLTAEEQWAILGHCRRTGTWIVADEVYDRIYFDAAATAAPSFLDIADPDDRLVVVGSFSKSFLMTGWRLGWLVAPPPVMDASAS